MTTSAEQAIQSLILRQGRITFARFMELALFHPLDGYYTSGERVGAAGDYYTSPAAHPAFGALLAIQLKQMWEVLGAPKPFFAVELGAGSGLLAQDILSYSATLGDDFGRSLCYLSLDRRAASPGKSFPQRLAAAGVPLRGVVGCILSNELVDAFPVHRFQVEEDKLREVYVAYRSGEYIEVLDEPSTPLLAERLEALGQRLPEGFKGEVNLAISPWMGEVVEALERGFVATIDYGHTEEELYSPARSRGTLQCYYMHTAGASPYQRIGRQDITAHVDFTLLTREGEEHGLATLGLVTQRDFLRNLGAEALLWALRAKSRTLSQREYYANRMGILELTKPGGLGDFRVLVQVKGVEDTTLYGLTPENPLVRQIEKDPALLEVPLLTASHTPLMEGRYPHVG